LRLPQSTDPPLMSLTQTTAVAPPIAAPGSLRLFWRSFSENRGAVIGFGVMVTLVLLAAFADRAVPYPFPHPADLADRWRRGISTGHRRCRARHALALDLRRAALLDDRHLGG